MQPEVKQPAKRGRPVVPADQRASTLKPPRTIRLDAERWEKLKALGTEWLERQIDKAK